MAILNQKRILNLIPKISAPVTIHVSQGDVGTEIEFTLVKGDELFVDTGSLTASVHGVREDGANFGAFACTLSGSSVKFPLHSEMTMVKGSAIAEIVLVDSQGNKVGSANFGIMVEESVFPLGVTYDNDVSVYESILAYVQTIPAQVTQDYNTKINAETAARQAADSSLNEALANEVNTRRSADITINARIDQIIAPSGEAPSAAEVTDARVGADGTVYNDLGTAIRSQVATLQYDIDDERAIRFEQVNGLNQNLNDLKDVVEVDKAEILNTIKSNEQFTDERLFNVCEQKEIKLVDREGNHLIDSSNNQLIGKIYLPIVDKDLSSDVYPLSAKTIGELLMKKGYSFLDSIKDINYNGWNDIPILYITNMPDRLIDLGANKSTPVATDATYYFPKFNLSGTFSKVKIQGNTSQLFPKKNYTLTFEKNVKINDSWGYHKKYVIKSNFNDFTQARNVCSAKLWGEVRKKRIGENNANLIDENGNKLLNNDGDFLLGDPTPQLAAINCGAIDGFPIMVFINNKYWGLYCFNIPKDDYMANMDDNGYKCIVSADYSSTNAEYFKGLATMEPDENNYIDFENEYSSEDFSDEAILESLNTMLETVMGTHSREAIEPYIDFNSAIDYYIFSALINNVDGVGRNYLLQTWDGVKWFFAAYDLDSVFGINRNIGNSIISPTDRNSYNFASLRTQHRIFHIIYTYYKEDLIDRYNYLRRTVFSESNLDTLFAEYMMNIPKGAYDYEVLRWAQTTGTSIKTYDQICNWYRLRVQYLDEEIANLAN